MIPRHLEALEVGRRDLTSYVVTETMHERKKVMLMNSDAVVALPGGAGTLDELFEALTWRQLGLHDKPVLLLNTERYWDPLLALIEQVGRFSRCRVSDKCRSRALGETIFVPEDERSRADATSRTPCSRSGRAPATRTRTSRTTADPRRGAPRRSVRIDSARATYRIRMYL